MKCLLWDGDLFHPRGGKRIADKLKERLLGDYFSSRTCARARVSTMGSCLYLRERCDEREGGGGDGSARSERKLLHCRDFNCSVFRQILVLCLVLKEL